MNRALLAGGANLPRPCAVVRRSTLPVASRPCECRKQRGSSRRSERCAARYLVSWTLDQGSRAGGCRRVPIGIGADDRRSGTCHGKQQDGGKRRSRNASTPGGPAPVACRVERREHASLQLTGAG